VLFRALELLQPTSTLYNLLSKKQTSTTQSTAIMTSAVAKFAAKKLLNGEMKKYADKGVAGEYDPYFAYVTDSRGKKRKVKKEIPDYIPEHQALILAKVRKRAYRLDYSLFNFLGIRFGWSSVVGIVPAVGDAADGFMAWQTLRLCKKATNKDFELKGSAQLLMWAWIFIDVIIGLIPFVGDLVDASVKANSRMCRVLEKELDEKFKPNSVNTPRPATIYEEFSDDDLAGLRDSYDGHAGVQRPSEARRPTERHGNPVEEKKGGWLSGGRKERQHDIEAQILPARSGSRRDGPQRSSSRREDPTRSGSRRDDPHRSGTKGSRR